MFCRSSVIALLALAAHAAPAAAQAWDTPSFLPPRPGDNIGVYVTNQQDFGIHAIWRSGGLGVRGGWVSGPNRNAFLVGAEAFTRLLATEAGYPLDFALTIGGGGTFTDLTIIRLVGGASAGLMLPLAGFVVQPYAHPRLAFDIEAEGDNLRTRFSVPVDLGADLGIGESLTFRFGATLGEGVYGLGIAWRMARGVAVR